jgi:hypothetical protein
MQEFMTVKSHTNVINQVAIKLSARFQILSDIKESIPGKSHSNVITAIKSLRVEAI